MKLAIASFMLSILVVIGQEQDFMEPSASFLQRGFDSVRVASIRINGRPMGTIAFGSNITRGGTYYFLSSNTRGVSSLTFPVSAFPTVTFWQNVSAYPSLATLNKGPFGINNGSSACKFSSNGSSLRYSWGSSSYVGIGDWPRAATNEWIHWAVVSAQDGLRVYTNSFLYFSSTGNYVGATGVVNSIYYGDLGSSTYWPFPLGTLKYFSRPLTRDEVVADMFSTMPEYKK